MIIKGNIVNIINTKINDIIKYLKSDTDAYFIFKRKGSFFRKKTLNSNAYVSDIDTSIYIRNDDINNSVRFIQQGIKFYCENKQFYITDIKAGVDNRFDFGYTIKKDGLPENYNPDKIRSSLENIYEQKIINKDEYTDFLKYVKDKPTIIEINKLNDYTKKYKTLHWSSIDIKNGKMVYRKKEFILKDIIKDFVVIVQTIFEFEVGKYIIFETGYVTYTIQEKYKNLNLSRYQNSKIISDYSNIPSNQKKNFYVEILKFYIRKRYFKTLGTSVITVLCPYLSSCECN